MGRYDDYDDDRMVIVERETSGSGLGALLIGLVIGAGAALLLAPESGEAMRARIRRETRRATKRAKEYAEELSDDISERVGRTRETVGRKVDEARETVDRKVGEARDVVEDRARAVGDAVDAGRVAARQAKTELERAVQETKRAYSDARRTQRGPDDLDVGDGGDADAAGNVSPA